VKTPSLYIDLESERPRWGKTWVGARLFRVTGNGEAGLQR